MLTLSIRMDMSTNRMRYGVIGILISLTLWAATAEAGANQLVTHTAASSAQAVGTSNARGITDFAASADGRYVAFVSGAGNVVSDQLDENSSSNLAQSEDVFLWDRQTNAIELVSHKFGEFSTSCGYVAADGQVGGRSRFPSISNDGRYVAFVSHCSDLIASTRSTSTGSQNATYVYDRTTRQVQLISQCVENCGLPVQTAVGSEGGRPFISADGRYVLFDADYRVRAGDEKPASHCRSDLFIRDRQDGSTRLVHHLDGDSGRAATCQLGVYVADRLVMSDDGRYVYFNSGSTDLTPGLTGPNPFSNIFVYEVSTEKVRLVTHALAAPDFEANETSSFPEHRRNSVSADGQYLVYSSRATNLVQFFRDPNGVDFGGHNYVYNRVSNQSRLLDRLPGESETAPFTTGDGESSANVGQDMAISDNGQWIVYQNGSSNLVAGATASGFHLYLFNQATGENRFITHAPGAPLAAVTDGARRNDPRGSLDISSDGRYVAYAAISGQLVAGQDDSRKAVNDCENCFNDIFLYDRITSENRLVSHIPASEVIEGDGHSGGSDEFNSPRQHYFAPVQISADGRLATYLNTSSNLVLGQADAVGGARDIGDVFQFDRDVESPAVPLENDNGGVLAPSVLVGLCCAFLLINVRRRRHFPC